MEAPDLSPSATTVTISEVFRWLQACVAMADSGSRAMGDLSAAVAVRSLSAAICSLLPAGGGADATVTKAQLQSMYDASFECPSPEEVRPDALPPLPKNIAKNFMATFKTSGQDLIRAKAERLKEQVTYWFWIRSAFVRLEH